MKTNCQVDLAATVQIAYKRLSKKTQFLLNDCNLCD
jgi:hypothetical protein